MAIASSSSGRLDITVRRDLVILHLLEAVSWFDETSQARLKELGRASVSRTQATLLAHIASGEHRPVRLANMVGISKQATSMALADLVEREMICFEPDPDDRRAKIVKFADGIEPYRKDTIEIFEDLEKLLADVWGEQAMQTVRDALAIDWRELPDRSSR